MDFVIKNNYNTIFIGEKETCCLRDFFGIFLLFVLTKNSGCSPRKKINFLPVYFEVVESSTTTK